jgi:hypothetical protein
LLLNVYLPYDDRKPQSLANYKAVLAELYTALNNCTSNKVAIAGDLNADPTKGRFWSQIEDFCEDCSYFNVAECRLIITIHYTVHLHILVLHITQQVGLII